MRVFVYLMGVLMNQEPHAQPMVLCLSYLAGYFDAVSSSFFVDKQYIDHLLVFSCHKHIYVGVCLEPMAKNLQL